jgi:AGCS family alanine or glycine:cation symporter
MPDFFFFINEVLWGSIMIYLLLGAGIWFTLRSGFIQFRYIRKFGRSLKNSVTPQPGGLTSFQALCTSLAARLGSGNLAGVALAISAGGPGAVFWMWVTALLGMATSFAESSLAQLYKEKDKNGQFRGGPPGTWRVAWDALDGRPVLAFLLLAYGLIFNTVQANSVAHAMRYAFSCPEWLAGLALALVVLLTISRSQGHRPPDAVAGAHYGAALGCREPVRRRTAYRPGAGRDCDHRQKRLWLARSGLRRAGLHLQPGADGGFSAGHVLQ